MEMRIWGCFANKPMCHCATYRPLVVYGVSFSIYDVAECDWVGSMHSGGFGTLPTDVEMVKVMGRVRLGPSGPWALSVEGLYFLMMLHSVGTKGIHWMCGWSFSSNLEFWINIGIWMDALKLENFELNCCYASREEYGNVLHKKGSS